MTDDETKAKLLAAFDKHKAEHGSISRGDVADIAAGILIDSVLDKIFTGSSRTPTYPAAAAIRYCPQGEVAYIDRGAPERTFPNRDEMWGRQVPASEVVKLPQLPIK